jgi:anhydro-N-acetylmuramic acid kinase
MIVIGLMSGTSCDAIEAVAADFEQDGDDLAMTPVGSLTHRYPDELRRALIDALPPGRLDGAAVCRLDTIVGRELAAAAARAQDELCAGRAALIASHGHTLFHWVQRRRVEGTLQIGRAAWIAERVGIPVISDLRSGDVAAGGQGAPLLSTFDVLALAGTGEVCAALNLGGIANITVVGPGVTVAYDTGPANALLDAAVHHFTEGREQMDRDGSGAARGHVHHGLLKDLLADPYYDEPPPKSTGKEHWNAPYLLDHLARHDHFAPEDVLATLTALTARSVGRELSRNGVVRVVASGGGTRNPTLMHAVVESAQGAEVDTTEIWGIPPSAKEAYGFALLGWLSFNGIPGNVPACTGARRSVVLGTITPGRAPLELPPPPRRAPVRLAIADGNSHE